MKPEHTGKHRWMIVEHTKPDAYCEELELLEKEGWEAFSTHVVGYTDSSTTGSWGDYQTDIDTTFFYCAVLRQRK